MPSLKNSIKQILGSAFDVTLSRLNLYRGGNIILMYHRVSSDSLAANEDPAMYITKATLEIHITEIAKSFDIVPLDAILHMYNSRRRLCAITFDDGWRDNYDVAYPILKRYSVPATIFIPPNVIGTNQRYWFQDISDLSALAKTGGKTEAFTAYFKTIIKNWDAGQLNETAICNLIAEMKKLPADEISDISEKAYSILALKPSEIRTTLSWDEIAEMSKNGITFGPHGLNHYILPKVNSEIKKAEIFDSLLALRGKEIALTPFFSYPNGDWDEESVRLVKEAGYHGALTTRLGYNRPSTNPFLLRRVAIHDHISNNQPLLWFRLLQAVNAPH